VETYEKFSRVFFQQREEQFPGILEEYFAPAWLPEEYQEDTDQLIDAIIHCERTYIRENQNDIKFTQHTITSNVLRIDSEDGGCHTFTKRNGVETAQGHAHGGGVGNPGL